MIYAGTLDADSPGAAPRDRLSPGMPGAVCGLDRRVYRVEEQRRQRPRLECLFSLWL